MSMDIRSFFGVLGNVTAMFLFVSPMSTFYNIVKKKSTERFSGIPYVVTFLSCLVSAWYSSPFITKHNIWMLTINSTGAVFELVFVLIFIVFAPKKEKYKISFLFISALAFLGIYVSVSVVVLHGNTKKFFCGYISSILCTLLYASPLSVMWTVIKTKSVEYMPFFLSLFVFLVSGCWLVYGILGADLFVAVPNGFGCVLGALQLVLYFIYRNNNGGEAANTTEISETHNGESLPRNMGITVALASVV